jgi:hypothetical protein
LKLLWVQLHGQTTSPAVNSHWAIRLSSVFIIWFFFCFLLWSLNWIPGFWFSICRCQPYVNRVN